jgi:hypothetical protein
MLSGDQPRLWELRLHHQELRPIVCALFWKGEDPWKRVFYLNHQDSGHTQRVVVLIK